MMKFATIFSSAFLIFSGLEGTEESKTTTVVKTIPAFTGKISKNKVRLRTQPNLESVVLKEMHKGDMLVVVGEVDEFYAVQPPEDMKAYVFRTFILDNVVEGSRVNVRSEPNTEAPVVAQLNTGDKVDGTVSPLNSKWLEITPPASTKFYIAKDFLDKAGDASYLGKMIARRDEVNRLLNTTYLISQKEILKPYVEIHQEGIVDNYNKIINEYSDFPEQAARAKELLATFQETYLHKKIAYLEAKAQGVAEPIAEYKAPVLNNPIPTYETQVSEISTKMASWQPREESYYEEWLLNNPGKSQDDFYTEALRTAPSLSGIIEAYNRPVKNKPGDFVLLNKANQLPLAYLYSTKVNLQDYVGHEISIRVTERPNNHFAFPAYYVLSFD